MASWQDIWFSYQGIRYQSDEPAFYDPGQWPWPAQLEKALATQKEALMNYLTAEENNLAPYFNESLMSAKGSWTAIPIYYWGQRVDELCDTFLEVENALLEVPGILSAGLSIMSGSSQIHPHHGETSAILRCHFAIDVPGELPECGFQVLEEKRPWKAGAPLIFCDANTHQSHNTTGQARVILIVDVLKEQFEPFRKKIAQRGRAILRAQQRYGAAPTTGQILRTLWWVRLQDIFSNTKRLY